MPKGIGYDGGVAAKAKAKMRKKMKKGKKGKGKNPFAKLAK